MYLYTLLYVRIYTVSILNMGFCELILSETKSRIHQTWHE